MTGQYRRLGLRRPVDWYPIIQAAHDAAWRQPLPRRWHRCTAAALATDDRTVVMYCACGAFSFGGLRWGNRNGRRRKS